ncbi:MAG: DUF1178 family protein [Betaproteobacteria bacterium]|nr:DUF1178 family protein [Betaproteobacteria bacterium]
MIVFNLHCDLDHRFEGWFASHEAYENQKSRSLIECPLCGSTSIGKMLSAPRISRGLVEAPNLVAAEVEPQVEVAQSKGGVAQAVNPQAAPQALALQAAWFQMLRYVVENTVDVGQQFADEARRIHYHEAPERNIRGQVSHQEAQALAEEGIEILSLPLPAARKGPVQ